MNGIIFLNVIGSLFILYLIVRAFLTRRARKQCQSFHKQPFQIKVKKGSWKDRMTIIFTLLMFACWIIGLLYYATVQLSILYLAAILGMHSFYPLFREGKIGEKGIAIADHFISWQHIDNLQLTTSKISDFHYPNEKLLINTTEGKQYELIIDKKHSEKVTQLLKVKKQENRTTFNCNQNNVIE